MIQLWSKQAKGGPTVMLGLLPENVRRLRAGQPIFLRFRDISPDCPDWTVSICCNGYANPKDPLQQQRHISLNFAGDEMERFLHRRLREIPLSLVSAFTKAPDLMLVLFYTEDENSFVSDLMQRGVNIGEFRDLRGTTN